MIMPNSQGPFALSLPAWPKRLALALGPGHLLQPPAPSPGTLPGQRVTHPRPSSLTEWLCRPAFQGPWTSSRKLAKVTAGTGDCLAGHASWYRPWTKSDFAPSRPGLLTPAPNHRATEATVEAPGAQLCWPR